MLIDYSAQCQSLSYHSLSVITDTLYVLCSHSSMWVNDILIIWVWQTLISVVLRSLLRLMLSYWRALLTLSAFSTLINLAVVRSILNSVNSSVLRRQSQRLYQTVKKNIKQWLIR